MARSVFNILIISCILVFFTFLDACKQRQLENKSDVSALIFDDQNIQKTLLPMLFNENIVLCLTEDTSLEKKQQFEKAVLIWIEPLRNLDSRPLVNQGYVILSLLTRRYFTWK